ncbi:MAG TPA: formylmethanofuran dehydrogenase [Dissulfuribacter thermophilus]|uniref:Formylmethanofuran dehydrogenase n=1 Tax=Dissulfuribacter thermophilus TaxID=1156395 RepID=A0A7V2SXZ9_9BACT|nr:formylmethanofuran dehydrogenase [Dissulfuribacter thermophilus]
MREKARFDALLKESVKLHGHLCPGQVLGVRMAMLGLDLIGIHDPKGSQRKDFMVFVEIDRCATDAIQSVTGCSLGKRSLRYVDYGIMAATFVRLGDGRAFRVVAKEEAREKASDFAPDIEDKYRRQLEAYKVMPDEELFEVQEVEVSIAEADMPGRPLRRVRCEGCGEYVQDFRDVEKDGKILCRPCAFGGYFRRKD